MDVVSDTRMSFEDGSEEKDTKKQLPDLKSIPWAEMLDYSDEDSSGSNSANDTVIAAAGDVFNPNKVIKVELDLNEAAGKAKIKVENESSFIKDDVLMEIKPETKQEIKTESEESPEEESENSNSPKHETSQGNKRQRHDTNPKEETKTEQNGEPLKKKRNTREMENDPVTLQRRQKQIDYGKNTLAYDNYRSSIPIECRTKKHPKTPEKCLKYSRRSWDTLIKIWRKKLHAFDLPSAEVANGE